MGKLFRMLQVFLRMKQKILDFLIDDLSAARCTEEVFARVSKIKSGFSWLACMNPHSYAEASRNNIFKNALKSANWLIPDGIGFILASRVLGASINARVTGADIFIGLMNHLDSAGGMSVFFLGGTEETLSRLTSKCTRDFPNIRVAGTYSPSFSPFYTDVELDEMIASVNLSGADVLWVGMTAPKQEIWIEQNKSKLNVKFAGAVGAVFDYYTGQVKRPHSVFQSLGLEWFFRLLQQPRRLWRRSIVSAPIFLAHVVKAIIAGHS